MGSSSLEDNADDEHASVEDHSPATTDAIGHGSAEESTKESTGREDGDNFRCLVGVNIEVSLVVSVSCGEVIFPVSGGCQSIEADQGQELAHVMARMPPIVPVS